MAREAADVHTINDWMTMGVFAGLIVLFLHRSMGPAEPRDHLWQYLPPAVGCAIANYIGNQGFGVWAGLILLGVIGYILVVLKPFDQTT
jgi:divalent metal cation (Fe/Co/Zn/Cd) transporter